MLLITVTHRQHAYLAQRDYAGPTPGIDLPAREASLLRRNVCPGNSGENDQSLALLKSIVPAQGVALGSPEESAQGPGWGAQNRVLGAAPGQSAVRALTSA